ncbi:hypothetical protein CLIM01_09427 [Colletotrichum limetticola]|uniref:Uncharacterized protein n=1 Tax=Colletotrichum limetticola TaxID=1209924 RepID=A0ABQ9PNT2_9PEZI|nr:hypothetical protein CLIM01_09427 [Colletotrichum limetticola]
MDSLWNNLVDQDKRCCLAVCLAVNDPNHAISVEGCSADAQEMTEQISSKVGDRFMAYLVGCLRGPLPREEFVIKVAALLACFKIRARLESPHLYQRTNLLFELDKILDHDFSKPYVGMQVLEQTLWLSVRVLETQEPNKIFEPGLLPSSYEQVPESVSRHFLQLYCMIRCLFPSTHEASVHRVHGLVEPAHFGTAEYPGELTVERESGLDLLALFEAAEMTSEEENTEIASSNMDSGAEWEDSCDESLLEESSESCEDDDEEDDDEGDDDDYDDDEEEDGEQDSDYDEECDHI